MKQQFSNKAILALLCGAAIIFHPAVVAQTNSTVSVSNSLDPLNPIIVTATRTPKSGNDVLADFTYISREEIENAAQSSLPDLLQQQRGVQISSSGGAGNISSIYLRGTSNAQSLVLVDGVKIDSVGGGAMWNSIPLSLIDHIEIIYGPQSTFYGSDAMGGVVQIFTKKGVGESKLEATAGYGTYNTSISSASLFGSLDKENLTNYSIGISQENSAGFNTVANNNTANANGSNYRGYGAYPTTPTAYTRLATNGSITTRWAANQEIGIKIFASRNQWQYPSNEYISGQSEVAIGVNQLSIFSAFSKNQITENWNSLFQASSSTNAYQSLGSQSNDKLVTPAYNFLWQNDLKVGADKLQILLERNMQYANMDNSSYLTYCNYGNAGACNNINVSQLRITNSVAGSYELRRGNNLATLALRNDQISQYGSKVTYSAAYGYFFTKEFRVNANYGTGFRAPSFNDLYYPGYGNANIKPESNKNFEAGMHYETQNYGVHLTAYQNKIENFIIPILCSGACDSSTYYSGNYPVNFSLVQIKGASLGIDGKINDLTLKGSADTMSTVDQTTGLAVPNRANWVGNLLADYKIQKFNVGTNITLNGARWGSVNSTQTANTNNLQSYTLVGFYGSYQIEKNLSTFIRWNNVFNSQYQTNYGYSNAGSNVFTGIRYAMK
jgi:vitamin B12 transporter